MCVYFIKEKKRIRYKKRLLLIFEVVFATKQIKKGEKLSKDTKLPSTNPRIYTYSNIIIEKEK